MPSSKSKRDKSPPMPDLEPIELPTKLHQEQKQQPPPASASTAASATANGGSDNKQGDGVVAKEAATTATGATDVDIADLTQPSSSTKRRVNALMNNYLKYIEAQAKYFEDFHALQNKYAQVYGEIFERRKKIVSGECEPSVDESKWPPLGQSQQQQQNGKHDANGVNENATRKENGHHNKDLNKQSGQDKRKKAASSTKNDEESDDSSDEKGLPNFWLEVLQSSRTIEPMIFEHDEPILAYLRDIRVRVDAQAPASSYTLEFEFAENNPYFRNRVLTKTFEFENEINSDDPTRYRGPELVRTVGCTIDWKPKKNVTIKVIKKKLKARNRKAPPKLITKEEKQSSFFRFFETHTSITKEDAKKKASENNNKQLALIKNHNHNNNMKNKNKHDDNDSYDDDDDEGLGRMLTDTFLMMHDFSIAERLRNKIIPKAVLYMTGEFEDSDQDDDDGDDDDDDDDYYEYDEDEDDDGDEDDYSDDDDDDDDKNKGKRIEWNKAMSEKVYRPVNGISPADCRQS